MRTIVLIALIAVACAAPVEEKVETYAREEQHQKVVKSAPVTSGRTEERVETYRADLSNLGQPVVESSYPVPATNIDHVNETEYRVNLEELENKFTTAQGQGSEGLQAFMSMIQSERNNLQKVYDQMSIQAEANVRGSLQKSREWEEKAKEQARLALERLMGLQRKAEQRTQELITRQSAAVECAECEERRIAQAQSAGTYVSGSSASAGQPVYGSSGSARYESSSSSGTGYGAGNAGYGSAGYNSGSAAYGAGSGHVAGSHHYVNQDANVETTTVVEEWSTVYEDHSSTVINV
ncbi:hypothetical protein HDE_13039 [Halotydeus destructor]|nr:hypothetical protein HDE_13039 [Halotydeus destructor]